ncbi:probable disease resistance protein At1g59620 [Salvia splendens]|uniref:probable disease resistance protein At1g59620 n=1 Tax=Salvia splendens TaxID=180675 RepID=UPI001C2620AB|nr:probable disease resistance protein At1g59620 [Salvia splendens]
MVHKCGYLPWAISLLCGVLRKKNSMDERELVNKDIKEVIYRDEKQIDGVLNFSYERLPYYLKPCFLYMGILFNEDETIDAGHLYKMWIAQGMISYENIGDKEDTLMDIAELYLRCELDKLPSSIRNLVYIDTIDLANTMNVEVPNVLKEMLRLKHIYFPLYGDEIIGNYRVRLDEGLDGLESLQFLDSRYHELKCMDREKNLRHFSARIHDKESLSAIMKAIMKWNKIVFCRVYIEDSCDLTSERMLEKALKCPNLQGLWTRAKLRKALAECESDLRTLKLRFLSLYGSEIEDDPMGILGNLPYLVYLQLRCESFVGEEMTCPSNSFLHLKELELIGLPQLREWGVEAGAMPLLSQLKIEECSCLEMMPEGLSGISSLQRLMKEIGRNDVGVQIQLVDERGSYAVS